MRLFDIAAEIEHILATQVDENGVIGDEAVAALEALEMRRDEKMLAIAAYLKGERAEGDAVKEQAKRLSERAKRHHSRADTLEELIRKHLTPGQNLSDARSSLSWRRSEAVAIHDENKIPETLMRVEISPDKAAIKDALKSGTEVPGCELVTRMNLQVK